MNSDYSFIINKPIDYSCLDSTNQHISNSNYITNKQTDILKMKIKSK